VIDVAVLTGPLSDQHRSWIADSYGTVDRGYADPELLAHLFERSPAGPAHHAFALDGGAPIGHCCVVPMLGRRGHEPFRCGKVEALYVAEPYRGRRADGPPVAIRMRDELYRRAAGDGIDVLHAYVRPEVGRVLDLQPVRAGARSFVAFVASDAAGGRARRAAVRAAATWQRALRGGRVPGYVLRDARERDAALVRGSAAPDETWTIDAEGAWQWYAGAPSVQVLELERARALVQLPRGAGETLRIAGWDAEPRSTGSAAALLRAAAAAAQAHGGASVRFQPWTSPAGDGVLSRACRLLGFVRRDDFATVWVRGPAAVRLAWTPLLALGF
jgi:hypothetical protein